jgi:DNA polymerase II large subunit
MRDAAAKKVKIEVGLREDEETGDQTWHRFLKNPDGSFRKTKFVELQQQKVGFNELWEEALKDADLLGTPEVKGVKGMTSVEKTPEAMLKGVLRYKHGVSVFRDGTLRWDMVDVTMTHFRPIEIGMSIAAAHKLGYTHDAFGEPLTDENQTCELRVQDVVLPRNCADNLVKATKFLDDLLIRQYGEQPYYNVENPEDLIGHLGMGIAPHTSGAIVCRIIGFADIKGHYGHPFFHAAKRRNCDGDIDAFLLLLDGILNFSRAFLAGHRGGKMDAPLILTMRINPSEIDKEALNVDTSMTYPISFYEGTQSYPDAKEAVKLGVEIVETRLGSPAREGMRQYPHHSFGVLRHGRMGGHSDP